MGQPAIIITISGQVATGKSTLATIIEAKLKELGLNVTNCVDAPFGLGDADFEKVRLEAIKNKDVAIILMENHTRENPNPL